MEDTIVSGNEVEGRFKNAFNAQVQYYIDRIWFKILGLPSGIGLAEYKIKPENNYGK